MRRAIIVAAVVCACLQTAISPARVDGQMVNLSTPVNNIQDSFFERIGVGWGFSRNFPRGNLFFNNNGGFNAALPPFGGHNPADDARFGFGGRAGSTAFNFNFAAGQGSTRSFVGQAPNVTVMNGQGGFISDSQLRPFVTGLIPVVGRDRSRLFDKVDQLKRSGWRPGTPTRSSAAAASDVAGNPAQASSQLAAQRPAHRSSAAHGDLSVAAIRRSQQANQSEHEQQVLRLLARAEGAEQLGKMGVAKIYYYQAANRAHGDLKKQLMAKVREMTAQEKVRSAKAKRQPTSKSPRTTTAPTKETR